MTASRRETIVGCVPDGAQLAARRAFVVRLRAGSEPAQRRLLGRVEHVSSGQATAFSPSTSRSPSPDACSPRSMSGGRTDPGLERHAGLQDWIPEHPDADLSVEVLARRVAMSPRNIFLSPRAGRHDALSVSSNAPGSKRRAACSSKHGRLDRGAPHRGWRGRLWRSHSSSGPEEV
jgi:hypothetical protein